MPRRDYAKTAFAVTAGCVSLLLTSGIAWLQNYPVKPIRMLIGFSPGGGADVVARSLTPRLVETLGQQIVVENRAGANGLIAAELAAKAAPDGYTLLVAPGNYAFAPAMSAKLPFDMANAFGAFFKAEIAKWTRVVQKAGIRTD
ncbi:MAG: hypothetical protein HYS65_09480 [Betaproteobacteria bacterium]|nr:hypothetical protein [Betaproteobacteria bacterium]MBI2289308.1 hypothetical protein [Betaproteobacteria bacterium]MBI3055109.1 hypothetical protein [Betaproteobacteria bacterium]